MRQMFTALFESIIRLLNGVNEYSGLIEKSGQMANKGLANLEEDMDAEAAIRRVERHAERQARMKELGIIEQDGQLTMTTENQPE